MSDDLQVWQLVNEDGQLCQLVVEGNGQLCQLVEGVRQPCQLVNEDGQLCELLEVGGEGWPTSGG